MKIVQLELFGEPLGMFDISKMTCGDEDVEEILKEWNDLQIKSEDNADIHLMRWGIERIFFYEVYSLDS